jgi:hypothetical protein
MSSECCWSKWAREREEGVEETFIPPHTGKRVVESLETPGSPDIAGKIPERPAFQGHHPTS